MLRTPAPLIRALAFRDMWKKLQLALHALRFRRAAMTFRTASDVFQPLLDALRAELAGDPGARDAVHAIATRICASPQYRDEKLSSAQVSAVETLLTQWQVMFSFPNGRMDAIAPLIRALERIRLFPEDADKRLTSWDAWQELMSLRGPGEDIQMATCNNCGGQFIDMSFTEYMAPPPKVASCNSCGHVIIGCPFENASNTQKCRCGGVIRVGCPNCGEQNWTGKWLASPWEYFADHTYEIYGAEG